MESSLVQQVVEILLNNTFDGGRHQVRIQGLENEGIQV